jgi:hypothetical protein
LMRRSSCPVLLAKGSVQTCCHGNENYSNNSGLHWRLQLLPVVVHVFAPAHSDMRCTAFLFL